MFSDLSDSMLYVPDSRLVQDDDEGEAGRPGTGMEEEGHPSGHCATPHVSISTTKVFIYFYENMKENNSFFLSYLSYSYFVFLKCWLLSLNVVCSYNMVC